MHGGGGGTGLSQLKPGLTKRDGVKQGGLCVMMMLLMMMSEKEIIYVLNNK